MGFKVGFGYDVHRFAENRPLILGGVAIPHPKGLLGHSDADVLLHAIADALLGAANLGDIGMMFPDDDPSYKDIASTILMEKVMEMILNKGYGVGNLDATVVLQSPKVSIYIPEMKKKIAGLLKIDESDISIKAKTSEGMGFVGREEGVSAYATVLIFKETVV
ncbi:MAG TPA: 2-C-methyl-D-erythritol 2,4-cyclodiphosphate synthase [Bacteroidetes bacterium]|nr:2-C-methyl-D-erythritol 2,4-cyclodiphosphate synthase [Bacteroidota bacterium]